MPGFKFTENQMTNMDSGFTPVTAFDPNKVLVTNDYGYAEASSISINDLEGLVGIVNGTFDTIASMKAFNNPLLIPLIRSAAVLGYYSKGDGGGGQFYWDSASVEADNGGTIIQVTGITTGRWKRIVNTSTISIKWFGCRGDGVTNDSAALNKAIDTFANDLVGGGVDLLFPKGTYILGDIKIPRGITLFANQEAKDNVIAHVPTVVKPAPGATYIFEFEATSKNSCIKGLYIDADWENNLTLTAAIKFAGTFNRLEGNNINACPQYAVYSTAGGSYIVDNNIQGWFGPPPTFTGLNDFRGALHIEAMGDSYVLNNEIGAAEPYLVGQVPTPADMLRDPVNRRICALAATVFMGNSVISGNIFENGDRAAVINGSLYAYHSGNRYEMCGGGGLLLRGAIFYATFIGERFTNNSLAIDGEFYDIEIETGSTGNVSFITPIFEILTSPVIPSSNFKVKNNILNKGSYQIDLVTPQFDLSYSANGPINTTDPLRQEIRQVTGQFNPDGPYFSTITAGSNLPTNPVTGIARMRKGTPISGGNFLGALEFYDANQDPIAVIGGNPGQDLWVSLFQNGHLYSFQNGDFYVQKNGAVTTTLWSIDGAGENALRMLSGADEFSIRQSVGGNVRIGCGDDITMGLAGGAGMGNMVFKIDGSTTMPVDPPVAAGTYDFLVRNTTSKEIQRLTTANIITMQTTAPSGSVDPAVTGTVTVSGNDTRGTITLNVTSNSAIAAGGKLLSVSFGAAYAATPVAVFSPESGPASSIDAYKTNMATGGFDINWNTGGTLNTGVYVFSYIVIK